MITSIRHKGRRQFFESGSKKGIQAGHVSRLRLMLADNLGVSASTLNRVINGQSGVSPSMALRLSKALGRSPESWIAMQYNFDLWKAQESTDLSAVQKMNFKAA